MSRWFLYFMFYSLGGYCLEKLFAWATRAPKQVRKCFICLPLCPVYGLSMTALLIAAPPGAGFWELAVLGGFVCTAVEYLVHFFYDKAFHVQFWDYTPLRGHIHGRVCPQFTAAWGLLSAIAVRWIHPAAAKAAGAIAPGLAFLLWMALVTDCVFTCALLLRRHDTELLSVGAVSAQIRASSQPSTS